jgi:hypothetical protein
VGHKEKVMVDENEFQLFVKGAEVPPDVVSFVRESILVLPGETEVEFLEMMVMMIIDIEPQTNIEWLCVIELASLWWEIQRYRSWKIAIIKANRAAAVADALYKTDSNYRLLGPQPAIEAQAKVDAEKWHNDSSHRHALNARLKQHGYNDQGINAHAFIGGLASLANIERFLASARSQVNALLREIDVRREFARRAREALERRLAAISTEEAERTSEVKQIAAD